MKRQRRAGVTIIEVLALILVLAATMALAVPTIAGGKGNAGVQQSMNNMATLGVAHVLYALDWDLRQVTWVKDDLGAFGGDVIQYNVAHGCPSTAFPVDEACQPPALAGWDCGGVGPWGYYPGLINNDQLQPMHFPDTPGTCQPCSNRGTFRIPNLQPLQGYVSGRYHDPVFYAPNDTTLVAHLQPCINSLCQFNPEPSECNPAWSSYCMSPASMFHHDVLRSNAAGGWQAPWTIDHGYQAPGLFQGTYPNLKTLIIEHNWIQNALPDPCNPAFSGCEPYYFNHSIDSSPVALFYDISVRLLPNTEAYASDQLVLKQTGGVDGLWHRGTSLGPDGYLIPYGYDGTALSHHILTTDGIMGRDTLGEAIELAKPPRRALAAPLAGPPRGKTLVPMDQRAHTNFSLSTGALP